MTVKVQQSKLSRADKELQVNTYLEAIRLGAPVAVARSLAGMPASDDELGYSFSGGIDGMGAAALTPAQMVEQMQAYAVIAALRVMNRAALAGEWRAAAWLLERLRPAEYGPARLQAAPATMQQTVQVQVAAGAMASATPALQAGEPVDYATIVAAARLIVARAGAGGDDTGGAGGDDGTA